MIKSFLKELISTQKKVVKAQNHKLKSDYSDDQIISFFLDLKDDHLLANGELANKISEYLQLLKEEKNYDQFSLEELKDIYFLLLKIHPLDISLYGAIFYYLNNVLNEPVQAEKILQKGIEKIERQITTLKALQLGNGK